MAKREKAKREEEDLQGSKPSEEIFIIKEKEDVIPWDILNEDQRIAILTFELGDLILKQGEFRRTVDSINKLFKETARRELQERNVLKANADTVNFLMEYNWLIPIVSDKLQVVLKQKPGPGEEIVPRDLFYKKVQEAGPVSNLVDIVSPYIPVPEEGGIMLKSKVARLATRVVNIGKYNRLIAEGETIVIIGFIVDYGRIWSNDLMIYRMNNIMNLSRLFPPEYKRQHYPIRFETTDLIKLIGNVRNRDDFIDITQNSTLFNLNIIDKYLKNRANIVSIKASVSAQLSKEINDQFPGHLLDSAPIKAVYGKYPILGKPGDLVSQRELWIKRNPYFLYYYWIFGKESESLFQKLQYEDLIKEFQRKYKEERHRLNIVESMYDSAISEQLTPFARNKLRKNADELGVFIQDVLTSKEKGLVEQFIIQTRKHRDNWIQNKCPHFVFRARYNTEIELNEKFKAFAEMIQTFGTRPEPETRRILCSNCGFNLGCEHEVLLLRRHQDRSKYNEITDQLEKEYYSEEAVDFVYCQFCGRKITDIALGGAGDIQFDEDTGSRITGTVIEDQSPKAVDLLNLIKTVLVHIGLQGKFNAKKILNFISYHVFQMYSRIEEMELKTIDTNLQKKMWALVYVYARIIQEIINSKFKINFRRNVLPNREPLNTKERETVSRGDISIYKLVVLRIIQQNDPKFFQEIQLRKMKLTFALTSAFNVLRKDVFRKDLSEIARLIELHGSNTIPRKVYNINKDENKDRGEDSIKSRISQLLKKKENILATNELLLRAFKFRLQTVANILTTPIRSSEWKSALDIRKLNEIYESRTFWSKQLYYRYFPEIKLPWLIANEESILNLYTPTAYCENGTKQKWNLTLLSKGKETQKVASGDFKSKLKIQKKTFDLDYSPDEDYEYMSFNKDINILNMNEYSRDLENTECKELKSETKKIKMTKNDHKELRDKAINIYEDSRLKLLLLQACAGEPGHIISAGNVHIVCGIDVIDIKLVRKFRKELEKFYATEETIEHKLIIPKLDTFNIKQVKDFDFNTSTFNQEELNKLTQKLTKLSDLKDLKPEDIVNTVSSLGKFTQTFQENAKELEKLKFKLPKEDREAREKELRRDQNLARMQELINIITQLHQYYTIIKTHPNNLFFPVSPSHRFLVQYVNDKKNKEFTKSIPVVFNFHTYTELQYDNSFTLSRKIIIFLNILVSLANFIVETSLEAKFVIEFLAITRNAEDIVDATESQIEIIQENLDLLRRKRTEKFLKMTQEEKIAQGIIGAGLEEQIEILEENIKEKNENAEEAQIETYDDEEAQRIQDEDFESIDDVDYESGSFDLL